MRNSDSFSISLMCKVFNVSRASFYHYFYYSKNNYDDIINLMIRITEIFFDSKMIYGAPRITAVLRSEGRSISQKTVAKYMNILELESIVSQAFPTKQNKMSEHEKSLIKNLIKDLNITHPNQVWTTDITFIKLSNGSFVYLSSIIDLFSRKVIAWNIGTSLKKELVIETLNIAFKARNYPKNVIIHSDKGAQYRSYEYRQIIAKHHCLFSYTSFNHSCDENSNQESFHASLKKEWIYLNSYHSLESVERAVFEYIEGFYNTSRIHSALGYVSPSSFENNYFSSNPPLLPV